MPAIYDPEFWKLTWNGILIGGFATGSFLKLTRRAESIDLAMGADGFGTFILKHDRSAQLEFTLRREHPCVALLSAKLTLMERGGVAALGAIGPLMLEQSFTGSGAEAQWAALMKQPDMEGGTDYSPIAFSLLIENAAMFNGAPAVTGQR